MIYISEAYQSRTYDYHVYVLDCILCVELGESIGANIGIQ